MCWHESPRGRSLILGVHGARVYGWLGSGKRFWMLGGGIGKRQSGQGMLELVLVGFGTFGLVSVGWFMLAPLVTKLFLWSVEQFAGGR